MEKIVVVVCQDFERIVRERHQEPEMKVRCFIEDGQLLPFGGDLWATVMSAQFEQRIPFIERMGGTITGYLRLADGSGFCPIQDEPRKSVAADVNRFAWMNLCEQLSVE